MKTFLKLIAGLLVLIVIGLVVLYFSLGKIVKTGVEELVPPLTKTTANVDSVTIVPHNGKFIIKNFSLGNPEGFKQENAIKLGEVAFEVEVGTLNKDVIVIDRIAVIGPEVTYEIKAGTLTDSNINAIQKNVEAVVGASKKKEEEKTTEEKKAEGPEKKFIIRELTFAEGKITVAYGAAPIPVPLPSFSLKNLGEAEGGLPGSDLALKITTEVTKQIVNGAAKATADAVKGIGQGAIDGVKGATEGAKDAAKGAADGIKNLFN